MGIEGSFYLLKGEDFSRKDEMLLPEPEWPDEEYPFLFKFWLISIPDDFLWTSYRYLIYELRVIILGAYSGMEKSGFYSSISYFYSFFSFLMSSTGFRLEAMGDIYFFSSFSSYSFPFLFLRGS